MSDPLDEPLTVVVGGQTDDRAYKTKTDVDKQFALSNVSPHEKRP